jgi:hypothetical protein
MPLPVWLEDPLSEGRHSRVYGRGSIPVSVVPTPPGDVASDAARQRKLYAGKLTNNESDSSDLTVDGSSTPVEFSVDAESDRILTILQLRFLHHSKTMKMDSGLEPRTFGVAGLLATGLELEADQDGLTTSIWSDPVTNTADYWTYCDAGSLVNLVDGIAATVDYMLQIQTLLEPVVLMPGTKDRVVLRVNDDLSSLTLFEVFVFGIQELL